MKYKGTMAALGNMQLWEDYPGTDDSGIYRMLMIENGKITGDEAVEMIKKEGGWFDEDLGR